ncbi:hypothetical protein [Lysinibacillus piscis]|uniref:Lipoprotein n=1 Tax=Lysinibacillus piscis TaxID=2518931 RepID=A0ABQ5NN63_9BACI|nr:hypothetical protein [Lysinibacillus sp. KH24]GLC89527.1 lipoprotein [Lysinibacillus sp. KH24]
MKKRYMAMALLSLGLLSACTNQAEQPEKQSEVKEPEVKQPVKQEEPSKTTKENSVAAITQEEALKNLQQQLQTDLPITLPKQLPITAGAFLTATTKTATDMVEIQFLESKEYFTINDARLKNKQDTTVLARLKVQQYTTEEEAKGQIAFDNFNDNGGQEVELGYGLKGYQDAGAGSLWTSWNEGRWALVARTRTDNAQAGVELAKQAVTYLESHMLPIPKQYGYVHLDIQQEGNVVVWQDGKLVYTLDSVKEPLTMLEIATAFYQ